MAYKVERNIVVPDKYVQNASGYVAPFRQIHLHSTANPSAQLNNEVAYLSRNYQNGNYTHLVGENGRVIQVAEIGQGAWDVGGDWNAETYAAIEFGERVTSQADFDKSYKVYIELARDLAKQAGMPLTLDAPDVSGIKTHSYASRTGHGSDHTDPIAFLGKWGVSYAQLKRDIENGFDAQNAENSTKKEAENNLTEEIEMYLINCIDSKRWYISTGVDVRYIKTTRMLANYGNQFGKLNLRVDRMYQKELDAEFGTNATDPKRDISK